MYYRVPARAFRRAAAALAAALLLLAAAQTAAAGPIYPSADADFSAAVASRLGGGGGDGPGDQKQSSEVGDGVKGGASASAAANASDGQAAVRAPGDAATRIDRAGDGFTLSGSANATMPRDCPFDGLIESAASAEIPFDVDADSVAHVEHDVSINAMVRRNGKVTLVLERLSQGLNRTRVFRSDFDSSSDGSFPTIGPGSYVLVAVVGAESSTKGVDGEANAADFRVTVTPEAATPAAIPLPASVMGGLVMLSLAALAAARMRHGRFA